MRKGEQREAKPASRNTDIARTGKVRGQAMGGGGGGGLKGSNQKETRTPSCSFDVAMPVKIHHKGSGLAGTVTIAGHIS